MTLLEAIQSGRKFKRLNWANLVEYTPTFVACWDGSGSKTHFDSTDILATDWEVLICETHCVTVHDLYDPLYEINGVLTCTKCGTEKGNGNKSLYQAFLDGARIKRREDGKNFLIYYLGKDGTPWFVGISNDYSSEFTLTMIEGDIESWALVEAVEKATPGPINPQGLADTLACEFPSTKTCDCEITKLLMLGCTCGGT